MRKYWKKLTRLADLEMWTILSRSYDGEYAVRIHTGCPASEEGCGYGYQAGYGESQSHIVKQRLLQLGQRSFVVFGCGDQQTGQQYPRSIGEHVKSRGKKCDTT